MKFGHRLEDEAIPEWAPKYINYKHLKHLIYEILKANADNLHPFGEDSSDHEDHAMTRTVNIEATSDRTEEEKTDENKSGTIPLLPEEKEFLSFLTLEVHKVENFYFEQLKVARNKKDLIMQQIEKLLEIERLQSSRKGSLQDSYDDLQLSYDDLEAQNKAKELDSRLNLSADGSSDNMIYRIIESKDDLALLENERNGIEKQLGDEKITQPRANSWSEGFQPKDTTKLSDDFFIGPPTAAAAERSREASLTAPSITLPNETLKETELSPVSDWDDATEVTPSLRFHTSMGHHHSFLLQDTLFPKDDELPQERRLNKVKSIKKQPPLHHHRHRQNHKHKHKNPRSHVKNLFNIKTAIFQHTSRNNNAFAKKNIRKALIELYRSLELLKEFRDLNILAYNKIVKKFEKNTKHGLKETLLHEFMITPFYTSTEQASMFQQVEDLYEKHYANGDHHLAMKALRTLGFESIQAKENAYDNLFVGLFTGINIMLIVTILRFMFKHSSYPEESTDLGDEVNGLLLMYFGFSFPLLISNLIIINMYVWDGYQINFRLVCGVSPRTSTSQYAVFVSFLFLVYLTYVYISITGQLDWFLFPFTQVWVLLILMLTIVANSFKYYQSSRIWLGVLIWRIVSAPLYPCIFKDFFVADQLVSMSPFYQSVGLLLYATFTRSSSATYAVLKSGSLPFTWYIAFFPMIPFFWRAMQCLRRFSDGLKSNAGYTQLINCSRYSLGIMVLILSTVQTIYKEEKAWNYFYIVIRVIYSIFSYYWDINMDWGLGNGRMITDSQVTTSVTSSDIKEKMIVYPAWVYYFVIATDGLTRFIWLPFSILSIYAIKVPTASYYLAVIELLRRFQWNFVRVEIEHVHNCEKLQVTEDVDLPFRTQDLFVSSSSPPSSPRVNSPSEMV
eukprot:gene10316-11221_t